MALSKILVHNVKYGLMSYIRQGVVATLNVLCRS
jgi:hypothetical protein